MLNEVKWWLHDHTPRALWYEVKWFIQRGQRGWSDSDNWSMFSYIGPIMADMLKGMRETGVSYTCVHGLMGSEVRGAHMLDSAECKVEDWWALLHRIEFGLRYYEYVMDGDCHLDYSFDAWRGMMETAEAVKNQAFADLGEYWGAMWD